MSGLKSRRKGMAREYQVRDEFRKLGFEAHRIPASGASQGFKGDVEVRTKDKTFTVEVKSRKSSFKWLYNLEEGLGAFFSEASTTPISGIVVGTHLVAISKDFLTIYQPNKVYFNKIKYADVIIKRFNKLKELKGEADYLVIKDDNKPFLYLSFE